jgi:two-component system response regulator FixJ
MSTEKKVYVVDDDAAVRRSLERLLDAAGFQPVCFGSPMAFLEAVPRLSEGCVLLDVRMPELDGLVDRPSSRSLEAPSR